MAQQPNHHNKSLDMILIFVFLYVTKIHMFIMENRATNDKYLYFIFIFIKYIFPLTVNKEKPKKENII